MRHALPLSTTATGLQYVPEHDGRQALQIQLSGFLDSTLEDNLPDPLHPTDFSDVLGQQVSSSSMSGSEAFSPQEPALTLTDFHSAFPAIPATPATAAPPAPPLLQLQDWSQVLPGNEGEQGGRLPLPTEVAGEETVYVNVKQYHCILRRRAQRARAEAQNKVVKYRKPYLHKSRHEHATKRVRGKHGRFLTVGEKEALEKKTQTSEEEEQQDDKAAKINRVRSGSLGHNHTKGDAGTETLFDFTNADSIVNSVAPDRQGSGALLPPDDTFIF